MVVEFTKPEALNFGEPVRKAISFANTTSGEEFTVTVTDKFPQLGTTHIEGRHSVEISVELFIALVRHEGFIPVAPHGATTSSAPAPTEDEGEDA